MRHNKQPYNGAQITPIVAAPSKAVEALPAPPVQHTLDEKTAAEIRAILAVIAQARQRLEASAYDFGQVQAALQARVRAAATEFRIDVDDPAKGRWNFNTDTLIFTRLE